MLFSHNHNHHNKSRYQFLITIKLVVVMSAVERWKAQQLLLSQRFGSACSKWRVVGNGENIPSCSCRAIPCRISSTALNRISTSSPVSIHRTFKNEIARGGVAAK